MALITLIRYGDAVITKITTRPYKISLALLIVILLETIMYLVSIEAIYDEDWAAFVNALTTHSFYTFFISISQQVKFVLILSFVLARTFEHEVLLYFIRY